MTPSDLCPYVFSVQRDISGAEDVTITSEYGGKVCLGTYATAQFIYRLIMC